MIFSLNILETGRHVKKNTKVFIGFHIYDSQLSAADCFSLTSICLLLTVSCLLSKCFCSCAKNVKYKH